MQKPRVATRPEPRLRSSLADPARFKEALHARFPGRNVDAARFQPILVQQGAAIALAAVAQERDNRARFPGCSHPLDQVRGGPEIRACRAPAGATDASAE